MRVRRRAHVHLVLKSRAASVYFILWCRVSSILLRVLRAHPLLHRVESRWGGSASAGSRDQTLLYTIFFCSVRECVLYFRDHGHDTGHGHGVGLRVVSANLRSQCTPGLRGLASDVSPPADLYIP